MEENCGGRKTEDGFCHLDGSCRCEEKRSRMEEILALFYQRRARN